MISTQNPDPSIGTASKSKLFHCGLQYFDRQRSLEIVHNITHIVQFGAFPYFHFFPS